MNDRKGFGSNFGFLMAAVGSAVGLGNIYGASPTKWVPTVASPS